MIIHKTQVQIYIHLPFVVEDTKGDGEGGGENYLSWDQSIL